MEKDTKPYVESINQGPNWLKTITIEIDKFLINRDYINFTNIKYIQWSKYDGSTSSSRTFIITRLPRFEKLTLSQFQLYIETQTITWFFCSVIAKILFSFELLKKRKRFLYFTYVKDP